jgi:hypothetical protein
MRDQDKITFNKFNGLWSRGDDDTCPLDHFIDCENLRFNKVGFQTREGTTVSTTRAARILRTRLYKSLSTTPTVLMLQQNGANADLYDLGFSTVTPIFAGVAHLDFSIANMYGRAYISFHDRTIASATGLLYVYDGTGPTGFRAAGGVPPTAALVETATGVGNIEAGDLLLMYCYETASGFITAPYVAGLLKHTFAASGNNISITVPNGPAGTVAKRIIAAKTIPSGLYNNDYRSQEFFFVPGNGRIGDNVTTALTLSFFNSELVSSADYLFDLISAPKGGLLLTTYGTRLIVGGGSADTSLVYVSAPGFPESISATSGFLTVDPSEQGGIKNGFEYQGSFIITKSKKTYVTSDNGGEASTWPLDTLDPGIGSEVHGISVITDAAGNWRNLAFVADRGGLILFNGTYAEIPLTDKIKDWWEGLDKAVFDQIQILIDTQAKRIYCLVPKGADNTLPYPNTVLVGDFTDGLSPATIKWCPWAFYSSTFGTKTSINCAMMDYGSTTSKGILKLGANTDFVQLDDTVHNDFSSRFSIPNYAQFPLVGFDEDDGISTFIAYRMRAKGFGRVYISPSQLDATILKDYLRFVDIRPAPGYPFDGLLNYVADKASITLHMNTQDTQPFNDFYMQVSKFQLFGKMTWAMGPSLTRMKT